MAASPPLFRRVFPGVSRPALRGLPAALSLLPLLACLLLPAAPAWGATVSNSNQDSSTNPGTLRSAASDDSIDFAVPGVTFDTDVPAVVITQTGTTLWGSIASYFGTQISGLASSLRQGGTSPDVAAWTPQVNALGPQSGMTSITHTGPRSIPGNAGATTDLYKLLRFGTAGSGLNLMDMHFNNVHTTYTYNSSGAGGITNGFIGNDHDVTSANITMGMLADNAFSDISVTMRGLSNLNWLAGGGIIGLRSTAASAEITDIAGNLFRNVLVDTRTASAADPYIEGGGVIGVDGVSSPAPHAGSAVISNLADNLFTGTQVLSGDIILGGGVVGLNNNSQTSGPSTYARLFSATGNIFGNGVAGDITVTADLNIRGGGSSASTVFPLPLPKLTTLPTISSPVLP